jgi:hypothetical protein
MLNLLHAGASQSRTGAAARDAVDPGNFAYQLRRARLHELIDNPHLSRWFADAYAGVDH